MALFYLKHRIILALFLKPSTDNCKNLVNFLFHFSMMMVVVYGLLTEGEALKQWVFRLSPLPDDEEQIVFEKFKQMNFVSLVCNGFRGASCKEDWRGWVFWLAGINSLFLWSSCMVILAFIPLVGISFVFVPACVYLYLAGRPVAGITLFIYCGTGRFFLSKTGLSRALLESGYK